MQTIERAFAVLRAIAESDTSAGVSEIARRTGLAKSTTSRILLSLDQLGMVDRLDDRYVIGAGLASISHHAQPTASLRDLARPYLVDLANELGESVALAVLDGDEMVYIDTAVASGAVQVRDWTGERFPPHTTSGGLVLMSTWADSRVRSYAEAGLDQFTDRTVSDLDSLQARIAEARISGVVWTNGEFDEDINGVAAVISTEAGNAVGAVNVSGPGFRFPGRRSKAIEAALAATCSQVSARFGS